MENPPQSGKSARRTVGGDEQDTLFEALSHSHRRFVLQYLTARDGSQTVSEMATALATWQTDQPAGDRSAAGVEKIESALHHHHLPKLAAASIIEYDPTGGTVTPGTRAAETTPYLVQPGDQ